MTISYQKAEFCPNCHNILDYYTAFNVQGVKCRFCGWALERNELTGEIKETEGRKENEDN